MGLNQQPVPLPDIFIGTGNVQTMVARYLAEKYPLLQTAQAAKNASLNETKSVWYSKEHIETLLSEINITNANGLRIYFGAYPDNHSIAPGQQCLLMVPTRAGENGNVDIVYENEPDFEARLNATGTSRAISPQKEATPKPFNYGSPCPPIC